MPVTYTLDNGVEVHHEFPGIFQIPPEGERKSLRIGDLVKLIFRVESDGQAHVERMWVQVTEVRPELYVGILDNDPYCTRRCGVGCLWGFMRIMLSRFTTG